MLARYRALPLPVLGFGLSVLGLVFCLAVASGVGGDALCFTEGCALVKEITVYGVSLWWFGAAAFGLLTVLCLLRQRALAYLVASICLLLDCALLVLMFFLAPCVNCLVAGVLFFCVWWALSWRSSSMLVSPRIVRSGVSVLWVFLFVLNGATALSQAVPLWSLPHEDGRKIAVFFSPSCPACRKAVDIFDTQAVFYGVAEKDSDIAVLYDLSRRVKDGQPLARAMRDIRFLQEHNQYQPPAMSFWKSLWMRLVTLRNQAVVQRAGYSALPVLMFEGLPKAWADGVIPGGSGSGNAQRAGADAALPVDFGKTLECGQHATEPCEDDASPAAEDASSSAPAASPDTKPRDGSMPPQAPDVDAPHDNTDAR